MWLRHELLPHSVEFWAALPMPLSGLCAQMLCQDATLTSSSDPKDTCHFTIDPCVSVADREHFAHLTLEFLYTWITVFAPCVTWGTSALASWLNAPAKTSRVTHPSGLYSPVERHSGFCVTHVAKAGYTWAPPLSLDSHDLKLPGLHPWMLKWPFPWSHEQSCPLTQYFCCMAACDLLCSCY